MMKKQDILLVPAFIEFYKKSKNGSRLTPSGTRFAKSLLYTYQAVYKKLIAFEKELETELFIPVSKRNSARETMRCKNHWQRFQKKYSTFLYKQGYLDNYIGLHFKICKTFLNWVYHEKNTGIGLHFKKLHVIKEEPDIFALSTERIKELIQVSKQNNFSPRLRVTCDLFLFGCTVGLRYSDLKVLNAKNIEKKENAIYLIVTSQKTNTRSRIKLPPYAAGILDSYKSRRKQLLPYPSISQFNKNLKLLGEELNWTESVGKTRNKNNKRIELKNPQGKAFRFCDMLSSHIMRKTAISTLLMHGVPEHVVRKISGHSANSAEFFRYVSYAQSFVDDETDKAFAQIGE